MPGAVSVRGAKARGVGVGVEMGVVVSAAVPCF